MGTVCAKSDRENDQTRPVDLRDFKIVRAIGKGAFGKVSIVERKKTKRYYALKYIEKRKCATEKVGSYHVIRFCTCLVFDAFPFG